MPDRRPAAYRSCPFDGCDWRLVTKWYIDGPHTVEEVPRAVQEQRSTAHLEDAHYTPARQHFT